MPQTSGTAGRPLSRLLIATDFTPCAMLAAARASLLHLAPRAQITLIHVMPAQLPSALRSRERTEARARLQFEAARLAKLLRKRRRREVRVNTVLAAGDPHAEILRRTGRIDLVIMGRHGTRGFRRLLIGSTAERAIRVGHVPVLIVDTPVRGRYRRVLAAVDLSPASRQAVEAAERILPPDTRMDVVHIYETAHDSLLRRVASRSGVAEYLRRGRAQAKEAVAVLLGRSPETAPIRKLILRRGDPRPAILAEIRARRADLVVVGSHGRSVIGGALVGSVAEAVVRHAPCDVLVVHP